VAAREAMTMPRLRVEDDEFGEPDGPGLWLASPARRREAASVVIEAAEAALLLADTEDRDKWQKLREEAIRFAQSGTAFTAPVPLCGIYLAIDTAYKALQYGMESDDEED
jgi:hypothetical protein